MIAEDQEVFYLESAYGYSVQDVLDFRQGPMEKPREIKELSLQFKAIRDKFEELSKEPIRQSLLEEKQKKKSIECRKMEQEGKKFEL